MRDRKRVRELEVAQQLKAVLEERRRLENDRLGGLDLDLFARQFLIDGCIQIFYHFYAMTLWNRISNSILVSAHH